MDPGANLTFSEKLIPLCLSSPPLLLIVLDPEQAFKFTRKETEDANIPKRQARKGLLHTKV